MVISFEKWSFSFRGDLGARCTAAYNAVKVAAAIVVFPEDVGPKNKKPADAAGSWSNFANLKNLERAKGFEPSTPTLARSCSTTELHPHPRDWRRSLADNGQSYAKCGPRMQQPSARPETGRISFYRQSGGGNRPKRGANRPPLAARNRFRPIANWFSNAN
jgi:hypothetical protein